MTTQNHGGRTRHRGGGFRMDVAMTTQDPGGRTAIELDPRQKELQ
jgi:hypothetical protein